MITVIPTDRKGAYTPTNNDETNGEIIGRINAFHDWCWREAESSYFGSDLESACLILGFNDVLAYRRKLQQADTIEKAAAATTAETSLE